MPGFPKLCVSGIQCTAISNQNVFYISGSHDSSSVWILCHLIQTGLIQLPVEELMGPFPHLFLKLLENECILDHCCIKHHLIKDG